MRDVLDMKRVHRKYVQRRLAKLRAAKAKKNAKKGQVEVVLDPTSAGQMM